MSVLLLIGIVILVVRSLSKAKKNNDEFKARKSMMEQQQNMLNQLFSESGMGLPNLGNAMVNNTNTDIRANKGKKFSIGWIIFFAIVAYIAYSYLRPYLIFWSMGIY